LRSRLARNVELHDVALSRTAGVAAFRVVPDNTGISKIEPRNDLVQGAAASSIQTRQVPVRTLDSFKFERVSMIKIDVEGHEEAVLDGAIETLRRNRPAIIVESEDRHNPGAPDRITRRLRELGYEKFYFSKGQLVPSLGGGIQDSAGSSYNHVFLFPERVEDINKAMMNVMPQHLQR
jgi:FkbM family methyltransferase